MAVSGPQKEREVCPGWTCVWCWVTMHRTCNRDRWQHVQAHDCTHLGGLSARKHYDLCDNPTIGAQKPCKFIGRGGFTHLEYECKSVACDSLDLFNHDYLSLAGIRTDSPGFEPGASGLEVRRYILAKPRALGMYVIGADVNKHVTPTLTRPHLFPRPLTHFLAHSHSPRSSSTVLCLSAMKFVHALHRA